MLAALDDATLRAALGRQSTRFRHDLGGRPELALPALAAVVGRVPASWVFAHAAQHDPHEGRGTEPVLDCTRLPEVISGIRGSEASIRIYNLERTAELHDLASALERRVRAFVGDREGGLHAINLGAFVASPGAVTPAHPDRHHNLLLQLEGRKEIWIEDDPDLRRHHLRVLDYLQCPPEGVDELPPAWSTVMEPGDAIYIPPYAFHWTRLFDDPGIALSIGFSTPSTRRDSDAHEFDLRLRRRGARPRPASPTSLAGRTKARLGQAGQHWSARRHAARVTVAPGTGGSP